jgi:hypothetical protein
LYSRGLGWAFAQYGLKSENRTASLTQQRIGLHKAQSPSAQELTRMLTNMLRNVFAYDDRCTTSATPAAQECKHNRRVKFLWP